MAERVDPGTVDFHGPGRQDRYPWDDWFDGSVWRLTPDDFPTYADRQTFQQKVYTRAKVRGLRVRTVCGLEGELFLQAYPRKAA